MSEWVFDFGLGFLLGFMTHQLILQFAYRRGIVEYKGSKSTEGKHEQ